MGQSMHPVEGTALTPEIQWHVKLDLILGLQELCILWEPFTESIHYVCKRQIH